MGVDLKGIKCGMEGISALNAKSRVVNLASEEGEREFGKKRKMEYLDKIPVSGKIPKIPEKVQK